MESAILGDVLPRDLGVIVVGYLDCEPEYISNFDSNEDAGLLPTMRIHHFITVNNLPALKHLFAQRLHMTNTLKSHKELFEDIGISPPVVLESMNNWEFRSCLIYEWKTIAIYRYNVLRVPRWFMETLEFP